MSRTNCATEKVSPAKLSSESSDPQARLANDSTIACDAPSVNFDDAYRERYPAVLEYLESQLRDKHLAEDLAQEVFVVAFRQRHKIGSTSIDWRNFLFRTAKLLVKQACEGRHGRPHIRIPEDFDKPSPPDTEDTYLGDLANELTKSLTKLTDNEARLYQMYYVDGATSEAIGQQLGKSPVTVRRGLMSVRKKLSSPL